MWIGAPVEQELPIIQIRNCLLVSIQTELHDRLALDLQASLMERVRVVNARGVILDVSAVEIIDSYITRILNDIGKSVRFMGAECYIVGIRPAVAMTLIEMGVELDSVNTALNLDLALERLELLRRPSCSSRRATAPPSCRSWRTRSGSSLAATARSSSPPAPRP
jgi:rsbT antagonist protein RsbS